MRNSIRIRRLAHECPDPATIEEILLRAHKYRAVYRKFEQHVLVCSRCRKVVDKIRLYYEILEKEISEGQSPRVVDFVKLLDATKVKS